LRESQRKHAAVNPEALIIAGPNGSGKSTLAYEFEHETGYVYLSADLIASEIAPENPLSARLEAGRTFFDRVRYCIDKKESFIAETTLSGRSFVGIMKSLAENGFEVRIAYVFLDTPEMCIHRVKQRVLKGGHDVPDDDIRRRFFRSKRNFWDFYRRMADRWYVYYNADSSFEEVALGDEENETVIDESLFMLFKRDLVQST
jgi:predicted ABC-type ATPase